MRIRDKSKTGVIVVDHGSRKEESNQRLIQFVDLFREQTSYQIVEPAHMEIALPSIADAFEKCVSVGVELVVVSPFFLLPGRHWQQDIPNLASEASIQNNNIAFFVSAPIGVHPKLVDILEDRIQFCAESEKGQFCDSCSHNHNCRTPATA